MLALSRWKIILVLGSVIFGILFVTAGALGITLPRQNRPPAGPTSGR